MTLLYYDVWPRSLIAAGWPLQTCLEGFHITWLNPKRVWGCHPPIGKSKPRSQIAATPASGGLCEALAQEAQLEPHPLIQTTHRRAVGHPSYELRLALRYIIMFSYRYG